MKRIGLVLIVALLGGCVVLNHIPRQTEIVGFDFTKYSEKGFLFTPGEYGKNYTTIGLLTFSIFPEARKEELPQSSRTKYTWVIEEIDPKEVIDMAYREATARKADAITHLLITHKTKMYMDAGTPLEITGIEVTGLLIRRIN